MRPELSSGYAILPYVRQIGRLVFETQTDLILDYGCGAAKQYRVEGVDRVWGIIPVLYDPRSGKYRVRPTGSFDGVICVDFLHYVPPDRFEEVLRQISGYAKKWVFVAVRCTATEGMMIVRPAGWWHEVLSRAFVGRRLVLEIIE